jgi:hypothetical protein
LRSVISKHLLMFCLMFLYNLIVILDSVLMIFLALCCSIHAMCGVFVFNCCVCVYDVVSSVFWGEQDEGGWTILKLILER